MQFDFVLVDEVLHTISQTDYKRLRIIKQSAGEGDLFQPGQEISFNYDVAYTILG